MKDKNESGIAIVGAGAVGSLLGGLLARAGKDVTLVARQAHADAINKDGLLVDGALGKFVVKVRAIEQLDFEPGLVLLAVKTQDVQMACQAIKPHVKGVPVVTLQNGVRSDEIAAVVLGKDAIIGGVVLFNAQFLKPGRVTYGTAGTLLVGEAFGQNGERVREISSVLNQAVKTNICANIQGARWTKLLMNIFGNSLNTLTGLSLAECLEHPGLRKVGVLILKEALNVVETAHVELESLPELPLIAFKAVVKSPLPIASALLKVTSSSRGRSEVITSTLQSVRRGKATEIEYLSGEIVGLGAKVALPTPYNAKVVELVHEIEQTGLFCSPDKLVSRF
jgi:2-dehydropantoate 2-reductase